MKNRTVLIIILAVLLLSLSLSVSAYEGEEEYEEEFEEVITTGRVLEITEPIADDSLSEYGIPIVVQKVEVEVLSGIFKGEILDIEHNLSNDPAYDIVVEEGDKVELYIETEDDQIVAAYISNLVRNVYVYYLVGALIILLLIIGRLKGLKATISLATIIFLIFKVLIPFILKGYSPIILSVVIVIISTVVTFVLIGGFTKKSFSAIIGTSGGVLIAAVIAILVGRLARLTGLSAEEAKMLLYIPQEVVLDFKGLMFAGIIIGSLGAVMDVSMSIASAMDEVKKANPSITTGELVRSGMNVGRDIMGTMTNTLILAYTGSSIPLLLLFYAYKYPFPAIMNFDFIVTEAVRSLSGSIGLVLTIPLTAFISGLIYKFNNDSIDQ